MPVSEPSKLKSQAGAAKLPAERQKTTIPDCPRWRFAASVDAIDILLAVLICPKQAMIHSCGRTLISPPHPG